MDYDIVISGGGMVGQAFALSIAPRNYRIAIIEPNNPNPTLSNDFFHTRVSAITPKSEKLLKTIGAWDLIARKSLFTKTRVWDQNSHGNLNFDTQNTPANHLGHIIENDAIQSALFAALQKTNVDFIPAKLKHLQKTTNGHQLTLNHNQPINCRLLIAADGARSRIRALSGIESSAKDYQQKAIICTIKSTKSFNQTIWQRFLADSIVALLPLNDTTASVVWSAQNPLADELTQLSRAEFARRLSESVEYRFGAFKLASETRAFALIERSAKEYVRPNLALIGDAAHNIHPLAGQGVNLGFSDVGELSQHLNSSSKPLDDFLALRKYARARRLDNELMAKTMTGLNWIYKANNEPMRWIRGFGMNIINDTPALKSLLQQHALGDF